MPEDDDLIFVNLKFFGLDVFCFLVARDIWPRRRPGRLLARVDTRQQFVTTIMCLVCSCTTMVWGAVMDIIKSESGFPE
jgi:hypothetical protein